MSDSSGDDDTPTAAVPPADTTAVPPADTTAELPVVAEPAAEPAAEAPRPSPGPRHAAQPSHDEPGHRRHPRRWFLAGAGAAVLAGAGGVGAALLRGDPAPAPNPAPPALPAAIAAERALLADLDATTGGTPQVRAVIVAARADHAAHLRALQEVAAAFDAPGPSPSAVAGAPRDLAELRSAEARAATVAAGHAATLDGRAATLLASIAACEAGHAELLA